MDGAGIMRQADGVKFKGSFKAGLKEGYGILEDSDGIRYEGTFREGQKDGEFVEKDRNGNLIRKVKYVNGLVESVSELTSAQ